MSEAGAAAAPALRLPRNNPISLLAAGQRAMREVPGLRPYLLKGFALLYGLSLVAGLVGVGLVYAFLIEPYSGGLSEFGIDYAELPSIDGVGAFFAWLGSAVINSLIWLANALIDLTVVFLHLALLAATVVLSLLVALSLMSLWFEGLVGRIVTHHRGSAETHAPFSLGAWIASLGRALRDAVWLLTLAVLALPLGFIPVIGVVLVVLIEGYLLGREVRDPYLEAREGLGDNPRGLRGGLRTWTVVVGLVPFVLAMVPVLGWVLLPATMVYLVAGFAWRGEEARGAAG